MALKDILKTKRAATPGKTSETAVRSGSGLSSGGARSAHTILKRPHITEKATMLSVAHTYTFEVAPHANKIEIKRAVQEIYKVIPLSVRVVNIPQRRVIVRGKKGLRAAIRKAYVTLKPGDTIEFA
ncbi:MAG: 50S ribosomal protein L23 [Minisyncoccota bacterium]